MPRLLFTVLLLAAGLPAQVVLAEGPIHGRLYPRDLATNRAVVPVGGAVTAPGMSRVHLVVTRDGSPWWSDAADLSYSSGWAAFLFAAPIGAGLHDYAFELLLEGGGGIRPVGFVDRVVCGDAFLINGQSNALAADYHGEGLGNDSQSRWIRSYGSATRSAAEVVADTRWHLADGLLGNDSGTVGAWGLHAARRLVDRYQVPIALLNGSVGGTPLYQHQRDDNNPENLDTIYGRLLYRSRKAGIDRGIRAMLWHQGEASGNVNPYTYTSSFGELRDDWLEDFPALQHVFVFQIRKGCGVPDMGIREAQRRFQDVFPDLTTLPTAAINEHDGCHFKYAGYRKMGERMAGALAVVLYGEPLPPGAAPPNIREARLTSPASDEIELLFRDPRQALVLDPGIESRFELRGGVPETVVSATASPGRILLQLSGPTAATDVAYVGHARTGPWITNSLGVGAFTFEVAILP